MRDELVEVGADPLFTLAHELAHLFVGAPGLSSLGGQALPRHDTERFCNAVAAEFLVPAVEMIDQWTPSAEVDEALQATAKRFKVSVLVAARSWRAASPTGKPTR